MAETKDMRVLHLTLKKKWWDMIASGEKKEEYREVKEYWISRLYDHDIVSRNNVASYKKPTTKREFDIVEFKNGYRKTAPTVRLYCEGIEIRSGRKEWGAEPGKEYFVIKLGEIIK